MIRHFFVWLHRWVGLLMAGFLIIEGLTGSLLAFNADLTRLLNPALAAAPPSPDAQRLDLATLAECAEAYAPQAVVGYFFRVADNQVIVRMGPRKNPATGQFDDIDFGLMVLDPWTGNELGRFPYSGYTHGFLPNIMPFVYDLHLSLALGGTGAWILGIVALAWTIDCFTGFYLTLPVALEKFLRRWRPAWLIKRRAGFFRLNFDLHRASGLWFWPLLFVFAWSSVNLVDNWGVYDWVTGALFDYQTPMEEIASLFPHRDGDGPPALGWHAAQAAGEKLAAELAAAGRYKLEEPLGLNNFGDARQYNYIVRTDRLFPNDRNLVVFFDADTGALLSQMTTAAGHAGNTVTNWLRALHMVRDPVDYLAYRILVCVLGLVIAMLSVTGVTVWWKKRRARQFSKAHRGATLGARAMEVSAE